LAWRQAALPLGTAITLSRPMAWWWPLMTTCLSPYSKESAGFRLQWYVVEIARKSGRAFCQRALLPLKNLTSHDKQILVLVLHGSSGNGNAFYKHKLCTGAP